MKLKVTIIGAGKVATQLALGLQKKGVIIAEIYNRSYENALNLAALVNAKAVKNAKQLNPNSDCYIIAVHDDSILKVGEGLSSILSPNSLVVHTSGAQPMSIFENIFPTYGVFYPLQTFTKNAVLNWQTIPIFINSNQNFGLDILQSLANKLSNKVYVISDSQREQLHIAAVFVNNFTNVMYRIGENIMQQAQLDFSILHPLILETAQKIATQSPKKVQTGPAARHDLPTIQKHIELLEKLNHEDYIKIYNNLTTFILANNQENI